MSEIVMHRLVDVIGQRETKGKKGKPAIKGILPMSPARWYRGVKNGEFPAPRKLGKSSYWASTDIQKLVDRVASGELDNQSKN